MSLVRRILVFLITLEARLALVLHRPRIVAVTGNLGKTSVKDAIFAAVSSRGHVRKSNKSFNSDIGVPLAILGLENPWSNPFLWIWTLVRGFFAACTPLFPSLLILEVGADAPGDIASIATWLHADIAVFTGVPEVPVHIENFGSRERVLTEKRALFLGLRPGGVVVSIDDASAAEVLHDISARRVVYGLSASCNVGGTDREVVYENGKPIGMRAHVRIGEDSFPLVVHGSLGVSRILAALAGVAVAKELGVSIEAALDGLASMSPTPGRMRLLSGVHKSTVIDDSYNSSPAAAIAALDILRDIEREGRRIAVLGDMLELGEHSKRMHRSVGVHAAAACDMLVTVGTRSRDIAASAREGGFPSDSVFEYEAGDPGHVGRAIADMLRPGDVVLIKGSQGMRLERAVFEIIEDKSTAQKLLVRHDPVWRHKPVGRP